MEYPRSEIWDPTSTSTLPNFSSIFTDAVVLMTKNHATPPINTRLSNCSAELFGRTSISILPSSGRLSVVHGFIAVSHPPHFHHVGILPIERHLRGLSRPPIGLQFDHPIGHLRHFDPGSLLSVWYIYGVERPNPIQIYPNQPAHSQICPTSTWFCYPVIMALILQRRSLLKLEPRRLMF